MTRSLFQLKTFLTVNTRDFTLKGWISSSLQNVLLSAQFAVKCYQCHTWAYHNSYTKCKHGTLQLISTLQCLKHIPYNAVLKWNREGALQPIASFSLVKSCYRTKGTLCNWWHLRMKEIRCLLWQYFTSHIHTSPTVSPSYGSLVGLG
jgi:hypothetical protein